MKIDDNTQRLSFRIEGEYITILARERFYQDNNPGAAIELLESCLQTNEISKEEIRGIAISILDGTKEITGTYPNDDYGITDTPDKKISPGFIEHLKEMTENIENLKSELDKAYKKISFIFTEIEDIIPSYKFNKIESRFAELNDGEYLFDRDNDALEYYEKRAANNSMLDDYIDSIKREKVYNYNSEEDYGWLAPDGAYYPVPWGDHNKWAENKVEELYDQPAYKTMREFNKNEPLEMPGDVLVYKHHYALLDNPHQGNAILTYDETYGLTKAQKEFLYDYYKERGFDDKANDLYKDDDLERE